MVEFIVCLACLHCLARAAPWAFWPSVQGAPYDSCSVLCISPREKSAMLLGHFGSLRRKWRPAKRTNALQRRVLRSRRGAVAANGYIYMAPGHLKHFR